jgi:Tetracyclin repressor-like, C-terminal domain
VRVTPTAFAIIGTGEHTSFWFRPDGDLDSTEITGLYADRATKMVAARPE